MIQCPDEEASQGKHTCCVALPGGIGTIEEFIETYTLKRLGIYEGCVAILNLDGFF
ncbi:hypothetical protein MASR1M46_12830 [Bacteroidales bacterium]